MDLQQESNTLPNGVKLNDPLVKSAKAILVCVSNVTEGKRCHREPVFQSNVLPTVTVLLMTTIQVVSGYENYSFPIVLLKWLILGSRRVFCDVG